MNMREHFGAFYRELIADEELLRLLYYPPTVVPGDSPLNPSKSNVLSMDNKWEIIKDKIKGAPKTDDLTVQKNSRVFLYLGERRNTQNYLVSSQEIIFDILINMDWEDADQRSLWVNDRRNEILIHQNISGIGKVEFKKAGQIRAPEGFVGYRLVYEIGSAKR